MSNPGGREGLAKVGEVSPLGGLWKCFGESVTGLRAQNFGYFCPEFAPRMCRFWDEAPSHRILLSHPEVTLV
jgi:hypothetical protein